jgi:hypothetical protein
MLLCWLGTGIPGLVAACLLVALGDAFRSGADEALLYRSCVALDREQDFQIIQAKSKAATLVALVILVLLGGAVVATWGFAVGWIVEVLLSAVGLVIACTMIEPPGETVDAGPAQPASACEEPPRSGEPTYPAIFRTLMLILPASWLGAIAGAAAFFAQTSPSATVEGMTVLVAVITLAEAFGAILGGRLFPGIRIQPTLAVAGTLAVLLGFLLPAIFVPAVATAYVLLGLAEPLRATAIQRISADDVRARMASIASACDKGVVTVALLVAGAIPRGRGL